jgi:hypothetical protein
MAYAVRTKVPIERTKTEIETTLKRYGADRFAYFSQADKAMILFEMGTIPLTPCVLDMDI